jgi:hypothetical protein
MLNLPGWDGLPQGGRAAPAKYSVSTLKSFPSLRRRKGVLQLSLAHLYSISAILQEKALMHASSGQLALRRCTRVAEFEPRAVNAGLTENERVAAALGRAAMPAAVEN